jgi:uncharacterized protein DUF4160
MPTVLRFGKFRVVIYSNDHRPAHVHVIGHGHEAVFRLNCPTGPIVLRENFGFSRIDASHVKRVLLRHLAYLCSEWERIHGAP